MTREEALKRLEGTWSFEMVGDKVVVRDIQLLNAIANVRHELAAHAPMPAPAEPHPQMVRAA